MNSSFTPPNTEEQKSNEATNSRAHLQILVDLKDLPSAQRLAKAQSWFELNLQNFEKFGIKTILAIIQLLEGNDKYLFAIQVCPHLKSAADLHHLTAAIDIKDRFDFLKDLKLQNFHASKEEKCYLSKILILLDLKDRKQIAESNLDYINQPYYFFKALECLDPADQKDFISKHLEKIQEAEDLVRFLRKTPSIAPLPIAVKFLQMHLQEEKFEYLHLIEFLEKKQPDKLYEQLAEIFSSSSFSLQPLVTCQSEFFVKLVQSLAWDKQMSFLTRCGENLFAGTILISTFIKVLNPEAGLVIATQYYKYLCQNPKLCLSNDILHEYVALLQGLAPLEKKYFVKENPIPMEPRAFGYAEMHSFYLIDILKLLDDPVLSFEVARKHIQYMSMFDDYLSITKLLAEENRLEYANAFLRQQSFTYVHIINLAKVLAPRDTYDLILEHYVHLGTSDDLITYLELVPADLRLDLLIQLLEKMPVYKLILSQSPSLDKALEVLPPPACFIYPLSMMKNNPTGGLCGNFQAIFDRSDLNSAEEKPPKSRTELIAWLEITIARYQQYSEQLSQALSCEAKDQISPFYNCPTVLQSLICDYALDLRSAFRLFKPSRSELNRSLYSPEAMLFAKIESFYKELLKFELQMNLIKYPALESNTLFGPKLQGEKILHQKILQAVLKVKGSSQGLAIACLQNNKDLALANLKQLARDYVELLKLTSQDCPVKFVLSPFGNYLLELLQNLSTASIVDEACVKIMSTLQLYRAQLPALTPAQRPQQQEQIEKKEDQEFGPK